LARPSRLFGNRPRLPRPVWLVSWTSFFTDTASEAVYPIMPLYLTRTLGGTAMAIGVIERCDGCIAAHAQGAARAGATRQEAAEAIGVTILMNGGPATIYGPRAYDAFCEFAPADEFVVTNGAN